MAQPATEACRPCHASVVEMFRKTGMGRSISVRPTLLPGAFYHRRSNRHYQISGNTIRRHQKGVEAEELNVVAKSADVAIGSGNHAITFVNRTLQGRLLELPLSWYSLSGSWGMSPGYDRADHEDFRREISDSCLFCHSAGLEPSPIDCARCHGPAQAHLQAPVRGSILNPAKLQPKQQLDICLQCHLQTASAGIQDSVRRPGRPVWSFQPGMALGDYKMLFARADDDDRVEINQAGYRLMQSACFRQSQGKLICTTCHDPHSAAVRANACAQCHATVHAKDNQAGSCESCHMPKRVPADAVQTLITDHKIARKLRFTNPSAEDHKPYAGKVRPFYVEADELSHAAANGPAAGRDDVVLYRKLVERDPGSVALRAALGKILLRAGRVDEAATQLRRALRLDPMHTDSRQHLGVAEALQGRHKEALTQLRRAVADNPDHALAWTNLGITLQVTGDADAAWDAFTEAIRLQPDLLEARTRRAQLRRKPASAR